MPRVRAGVRHLIGFNYSCNPLIGLARDLIAAGEIGTVTGFSGRYFEDYMADPAVPHSWRCERRYAGAGALADLGSHLIDMAEVLLGPIESVQARLETIHRERRVPATGDMLPVENEDIALALVKFASGVGGSFEISRVATGFKCGLTFTVFGTQGSVSFDQERMNELRLYTAADAAGRRGFRTILAGPEHSDYRFFCPAPGHGLGINDLKVIEARNLIRAIADGSRRAPRLRRRPAGPARHGSDGTLARERRMDAGRRPLIRERHMSTVITQHRDGFAPGFTPITTAGEADADTGISMGVLRLAAGSRHTVTLPARPHFC